MHTPPGPGPTDPAEMQREHAAARKRKQIADRAAEMRLAMDDDFPSLSGVID